MPKKDLHSYRLQIRLTETEIRRLARLARRDCVNMSGWIRRMIAVANLGVSK